MSKRSVRNSGKDEKKLHLIDSSFIITLHCIVIYYEVKRDQNFFR